MDRQFQLIPKKTSQDRTSQESKITSTPRTMSPAVSLSPSVSTILNDEAVPMEVDSDIISNESERSVPSAGETSSVDDSVIVHSRRKGGRVKEVKWEGFWVSLQPKNKDGFYYKIMNNPKDVESIAIDLVNDYSNDKNLGINSLLQLFVELSGYKKLSVDKVYNFRKQNSKEFVHKMESELMETDLKKTGKFLFMKCSRFETNIEHILAEFINYVVTTSMESGALFDGVFTRHVLEFINCMAFSSFRPIRITGVVLVLKFLTAFVNLYATSFASVSDRNSSSGENGEDNKRYAVESFIDFLYVIYNRNVLIPDKKCYTLKVKCVQEMFQWIKLFPDIFIFKRKCLGHLVKLVVDENETVRRSTLHTCEDLITTEEIEDQVTQRIELILKIVSGRIKDTSFVVANKAVTILTKALEKYPEYVTEGYRRCIVNRMFEENVSLAQTAGKFLAAYIHRHNDDPQQRLLHLVKITHIKKEFAERLPIFLHSCFESVPELEDWNLITSILFDENVVFQTRVQLLRILNEILRFLFTGKFSKMRKAAVEAAVISAEDRLDIVNVLIPTFENLLLKFQTDKACLKLVTEILMFISYDINDPEDIQNYYPSIFGLLRELFDVSTDKGLLENVTNTFSCFCENRYYLANVLIEGIKQKYVDSLNDDLRQRSPSLDRNLLIRLRETSMKLSLLFAKFDITSILQWRNIFEVWDNNSLKALKYLITCCKWHLVWTLRKVMTTASENGVYANHSLYYNCEAFIFYCLEFLRRAKPDSESFWIFEELCDLYASFEIKMRRKRMYSIFFIKIADTHHQEVLVDFVALCVIENNKLHLEERQRYLSKLADVIYLNVIHVHHFAKILRYYHTHYAQFGAIMDNIISQLSLSNPALPLLIVHTLSQIYKQILDAHTIVNILNDESKQLKLLAKKFASLKEIKSTNVLLKLVNMAIIFSLQKRDNHQFLYFARYFARLLDEASKSEAYNLFVKMVPEQYKKNDVFLVFAATLKRKN